MGYAIRFDDCTDSKATRIKVTRIAQPLPLVLSSSSLSLSLSLQFLTDGMLVREMMWDPMLKNYRCVSKSLCNLVLTLY